MSRNIAIAAFFILVFSLAAVVIKDTFLPLYSPVNKTAAVPDKNVITLPVPLDSQNVIDAWLSYVFRGSIREFVRGDESGSTYRLVLQTENKAIPALTVRERTPVFRVVDNQQEPAALSDLTESVQVDVITNYVFKADQWNVARIIILPEQAQQGMERQ